MQWKELISSNIKLLKASVNNNSLIDCTYYLGNDGCVYGENDPSFAYAESYDMKEEKTYIYIDGEEPSCLANLYPVTDIVVREYYDVMYDSPS